VLAAVGCDATHEDPGPDADSAPDGARDAEADTADRDDEADADEGAAAGPVTTIIADVEVVLDRLCDLDGDGVGDNAVTDLGDPWSSVFATAATSAIRPRWVVEGKWPLCGHVPWLERPDDAEAVLILFAGWDTDDPVDPGDDLSGDEPLYVGAESVDSCGEPLHTIRIGLHDGAIESGAAPLSLPYRPGEPFTLNMGGMTGSLDARGAMETFVCGYAPIRTLGSMGAWQDVGGEDITMLEMYLGGLAAIGIDGPGLSPDVDVDGDGLERIALDEQLHVELCIDGDGSTTEGRSCWQAPGMNDGFSLNLRLGGTPARLAEPRFGGPDQPDGGACDEPPESSLWDSR